MSQRSIANWNLWLKANLGRHVLGCEKLLLDQFLAREYGKHLVVIGVPEQAHLLNISHIPCHSLISPLSQSGQHEYKVIEATFYALPVLTASVDLVLLPHTLELVDNPRQLLAEACRIVKPEGHIIIFGFNPYSLWGLAKLINPNRALLPNYRSVNESTLKKWLALSDFELLGSTTVLFSPPIASSKVLRKLRFLEWLGDKAGLPCGGLYGLMAKAKVIPLTPIRMRWQEKLAQVSIPGRVPGPTIRNS